MLRESGNLLTENIPITKELLDFASANNYKISLKNGDYNKTGFKSKRSPNRKDILSEIHKLYISGEIYIPEVSRVFNLCSDDLLGNLRRAGFKTLSAKETRELWADKINERRTSTNLERYGVKVPTQSPEVIAKTKATNLERYGVEVSTQSPEVQKKAKATNLERYGVEYAIAAKSTREKARQTFLGHYGVDNPFKSPEVREKIRETNLERYGADNPFKSPEIREQIKQTCIEIYGGNAPTCSAEVRQKAIETNILRYGGPAPINNTEIRQKGIETNISRYGVDNPFKSPEIKDQIKQTNLVKYGIENPGCLQSITGVGNLSDDAAIKRHNMKLDFKFRLENDPTNKELQKEAMQFAAEYYPDSSFYNTLKFLNLYKPSGDPWTEVLVESKIAQPLEVEYIRNYRPEFLRHPVTGKCRELDFFFPDHKLAIEVNGDFTHHDLKEEHQFKYQRCIENGVTLLMFTEREIKDYLVFNKSDIIKDIVSFYFGGEDPRDKYNIDPHDLFRFGLAQSAEFEMNTHNVGDYIHWYPTSC